MGVIGAELKLLIIADVVDGILKQADADCGADVVSSSLAFHSFFLAGPIRMVGPTVKGFGVGHQSENTPGRITDAGNVPHRSIGVKRKSALGRLTVGRGILDHDLIIIEKTLNRGCIRIKLSFTMADRKFYLF